MKTTIYNFFLLDLLKPMINLTKYIRFIVWIMSIFILTTLVLAEITVNDLNKRASDVMSITVLYSEYLSQVSSFEYNLQLGTLDNYQDTIKSIKIKTEKLDEYLSKIAIKNNDSLVNNTKKLITQINLCQDSLYQTIVKEIGNEKSGKYKEIRGYAHRIEPRRLFFHNKFPYLNNTNNNDFDSEIKNQLNGIRYNIKRNIHNILNNQNS